MTSPSDPQPRRSGRLVSMSMSTTLAQLVVWGLWLRVAAADLVHWYTQRKGVLCVFLDARYYWLLAGKIRRGEPYQIMDWGNLPRFTVRTPGYPLFLAACQLVFGPRLLPARLVQAALGAVCVWLVARLTRRALPDEIDPPDTAWTVPLIAALLTALDPLVIANSVLLLSESVFLPLMLLAQWGFAVLWSAKGDPSSDRRYFAGWALLTGVASGAAVLVRPSWALYVPVVLLVWVVFEWRDRARRATVIRGSALVVLGLVVVMSPWWVRNARIYGKFVPTALWLGASLYDGLNPHANGDSNMTFLEDPAFWPLDEETQDAVLRERAIAFARAHPRRVLELALIKAARFWSPWPNAEMFRRPLVTVVCALVTLPQFALIALGVWDRRRDPRALVLLGLPLLYTFAMHLVFVSSMRYRVPVAVPALGLAAVGVRKVLRGMADGRD